MSLAAVVAVFVALGLTVGRGGIERHGPVVSDERSWLSLVPAGGSDALLGGVLDFEDGCLGLSGNSVIWPNGTRWDADRQVLHVPGGEAELGDTITGGGGFYEDTADTETGRALVECGGVSGEVMTFDRDEALAVSKP